MYMDLKVKLSRVSVSAIDGGDCQLCTVKHIYAHWIGEVGLRAILHVIMK